MNFVISLSMSVDCKSDSYNSILIIVDQLLKIIYYELIKVTINAPGLAKVIINVVVHHY